MIGVLMLKFQKSEEEILLSYNKFYADNPDGVISKDKYISSIKVCMYMYVFIYLIYPFIFIPSQNTMMAESLFRVFDEDKSGTLSFEEYFQANQVEHKAVFSCHISKYLPGVGSRECRGQALLDFHGIRLRRRRLHRLRRDHRHLPGPIQARGDRGGRRHAGLMCRGCQVRGHWHCYDNRE